MRHGKACSPPRSCARRFRPLARPQSSGPCTAAIAEILVQDFIRDVLPGARPASNPLRFGRERRRHLRRRRRLGRVADRAPGFADCNCVTWDDETMTRLSAAAERMRPGSIFVTVLCPLASDTFELVEEVELNFSWGAVECLVHRRMSDEAAALAAALGDGLANLGGRGDVDMERDA